MDRWSSILLQATSICLDTRPTPNSHESTAKLFPRRAQKISRKETTDLPQGNIDSVPSTCSGHQVKQQHPWKSHRLQDPPGKGKYSCHTPNSITSIKTFAAERIRKMKIIPWLCISLFSVFSKICHGSKWGLLFSTTQAWLYKLNLKPWFHNSHLALNSLQEGLHN